MVKNKKVVAIIPVRGGSKGIPRKNLYRLDGKDTLLERTIKQGLSCPSIDRVIVSTDDEEMDAIAQQYKVNAPSLRPALLSNDRALTVDVILHLIAECAIEDSYICLLQTTAPLRTLEDLNGMFKVFAENAVDADSIVSLTAHDDPHPNKIQKIENGFVSSYLGGESMVPRQQLPKVYRLNGAFYMTHQKNLVMGRSFFTGKTLPYILPKERSVNLDTMMDLYLLESMVDKGIIAINI